MAGYQCLMPTASLAKLQYLYSSFGWDKGTTNYTNYTNFLVAGMENYIEFHESIAKRCAGFDQKPYSAPAKRAARNSFNSIKSKSSSMNEFV